LAKYPELASQVKGIPATFILDSSGKVLGGFSGGTEYDGLVERFKRATGKK
jgi:hypothetical protein